MTNKLPDEVTREQLLETNRRLNYEKQRLESELGAYRRAVRNWEIGEKHIYVPLRTLAAIAKAAGVAIPEERFEMGHHRMVKLADAVGAVKGYAGEWAALAPPDDWGDTPADTTLADAGRSLLRLIEVRLDGLDVPAIAPPRKIVRPTSRRAG